MARNDDGLLKFILLIIGISIFGGAISFLFKGLFFLIPIMIIGGFINKGRLIDFFGRRSGYIEKEQKEPKEMSRSDKERKVLQIAKKNSGKITPALLALETDMTLKESEDILDELAKQGYLQLEVYDSGSIEYICPDFLPKND